MASEKDRKRAEHDAVVREIGREISEIGSGRRQPVRPESRSDGTLSRVRLIREETAPAIHASGTHRIDSD